MVNLPVSGEASLHRQSLQSSTNNLVLNVQAPDMPNASVIEVLHTPWTSWCTFLTSDLPAQQEQACQHIASLSLPELAAIRQVSCQSLEDVLYA